VTEDEIVQAVAERVRVGQPTGIPKITRALPPASLEAVEEAEAVIGEPLPPVLRRIYLEVSNGRVGPDGGILGVRGGWTDQADFDLVSAYALHHDTPPEPDHGPPIPPGVVWLCDWGCANWSMVDCRVPGGRMWWWEEGDRHVLDLSVAGWFEMWLNGSLPADGRQPDLHISGHPDTWERPVEDEDEFDEDSDAGGE